MELLPIVFYSVDIFLMITYFGIFLYLALLFFQWEDISIGIWALSSLLVAVIESIHLISLIKLQRGDESYIYLFKLAMIMSFIAYWFIGSVNLLVRRKLLDFILIILLTLPLGFIIPYIINNLEVIALNSVPEEDFVGGFTTFDLLFFMFFAILYSIVARDSHLIYNESIKDDKNKTRKSIAITHLIAWQFWVVGTASIRYFAKFTETSLYFAFPFILLLVPILTLSSRPFDWSREGHEPVFLLLIDQYGNPVYSWINQTDSPLLLEGSTVATINNMFHNLIMEPVDSMVVNFSKHSLYTHSSNGFLTLLLTTGNHLSFEQLSRKIHHILITDSVKITEYGIPGYDFPTELKWLLAQLLPGSEPFELGEKYDNVIKRLLVKSGLNFFK